MSRLSDTHLIEQSIEPKSKADQDKLGMALSDMVAADPSFTVFADPESGQTIMRGMGELHLDTKVDFLRSTYNLDTNIGAPQVAYRESLGRETEVDFTYKKQIGGAGQFARIKVRFEPTGDGTGFQFESAVIDGAVPEEFVPGVVKGLESSANNGLIAGFPVIDFKATLVDGAFHDIDSSVLAFEIAARGAFRELRDKASPKLLEPIMKVEVLTLDECMGDVIGDLNSRRARIQRTETRGDGQVITAFVPLANMLGYSFALRSFSKGRGDYSMQYDHHEPVDLPPDDPGRFPPAAAMRA